MSIFLLRYLLPLKTTIALKLKRSGRQWMRLPVMVEAIGLDKKITNASGIQKLLEYNTMNAPSLNERQRDPFRKGSDRAQKALGSCGSQTNGITSKCASIYLELASSTPRCQDFPLQWGNALHYAKRHLHQLRPDHWAMMERNTDEWEAPGNPQVRRAQSSGGFLRTTLQRREVAQQAAFLKPPLKVLQQELQIPCTNPGFVLACQFNSTSRSTPCWVGSERNKNSGTLYLWAIDAYRKPVSNFIH